MEHRESKYLRAKEKVGAIKKFYSSLFSSIFIILFIGGINYYVNRWYNPWFLWVVFGLGIGLVSSAFKAFGYDTFFGKNWEQRKIREFLEEEDYRDRWK